jgi:hypothetical protein
VGLNEHLVELHELDVEAPAGVVETVVVCRKSFDVIN